MLERFGLSCTVLQQTVSFVSHRIRRARHLEGGTTDAGEGVGSRQTRSRNTNEGLNKIYEGTFIVHYETTKVRRCRYLRSYLPSYLRIYLYTRMKENAFVRTKVYF